MYTLGAVPSVSCLKPVDLQITRFICRVLISHPYPSMGVFDLLLYRSSIQVTICPDDCLDVLVEWPAEPIWNIGILEYITANKYLCTCKCHIHSNLDSQSPQLLCLKVWHSLFSRQAFLFSSFPKRFPTCLRLLFRFSIYSQASQEVLQYTCLLPLTTRPI